MSNLQRNLMVSAAFSLLVFSLAVAPCTIAYAQTTKNELLTSAEWKRIDESVKRSLQWLATQQQSNGSFPTLAQGQPGVTALCVMAFVSHGHLPGEGPYGTELNKALEFIISCQQPSGLLAQVMPPTAQISRNIDHERGSTAAYNHALSALLLSEVFAMGGGDLEKNQQAIEKAVSATLAMQRWSKTRPQDSGGWRYINRYSDGYDSDLSVTGWELMFLRSAKNAGFEVPKKSIDDAVGFVRRCFQPQFQTFTIMADTADRRSRGMAGAGILALAHAGLHDSQEAKVAGQWLLKEGFARYNESRSYTGGGFTDDRYHYGVFCACQAMYQLGGEYWQEFYPPTARVILDNQSPNGAWKIDSHRFDDKFGKCYTTALMTMTLGAPNQLLPIFQR